MGVGDVWKKSSKGAGGGAGAGMNDGVISRDADDHDYIQFNEVRSCRRTIMRNKSVCEAEGQGGGICRCYFHGSPFSVL